MCCPSDDACHSAPIIQRCYARFLEESNNPDDREYPEDADQIREALIQAHYLSQKDIEICAAFDIADEFDTHPNLPGIEALHQTLAAAYTEPKGERSEAIHAPSPDARGGLQVKDASDAEAR